jgi:hypothetical protein
MARTTSATLSLAEGRNDRSSFFAEIRTFWREFFVRAFDPYRPELHYMRGPGPACRAKNLTLTPGIEMRAAKVHRSSLR